ncbi:conserved exported protein of unknown function [Paraburkholderia kururiensis]
MAAALVKRLGLVAFAALWMLTSASQAETQGETRAENQAETRAENQADTQADTQAENQAENRADTQPQPQPQTGNAAPPATTATTATPEAAPPALTASASSTADFDAATRAQLAQIVAGQIAAHRVPGAVVVAGDATHIALHEAYGDRMVTPEREPMTEDTVFDLASLTKVIATTTAVMQLVERGRLALDQPVAHYWPAFAAGGKDAITVRQLLTHTSGLPPDPPLPAPAAPDEARAALLRGIAASTPATPPGERVIYSDINFIVLGELVARVSGMPLDAWCRKYVFAPLGMRDTMFLPDAAHIARTAPTTMDHGSLRRGRVHDPIAARAGGMLGHAGLFSTAADLARFAQMLLNGGQLGGVRVLTPQSVAAMATPDTLDTLGRAGSWRGLGWETGAPLVANRDRLPAVGTMSHTGYTGTALWIDLATGRFVVILTNRVHPDDSGDARPLRDQITSLFASRQAPLSAAALAQRAPWAAPALAFAAVLPASYGPVATGIDVLEAQQFAPLAGFNVGLVTNRTGFDAQGHRTVDVLARAPGMRLVALFAPEHGLTTDVDERVADAHDAATGLVVHSLYGRGQRFAPQSLDGVSALVFDLQDAGVRFFTYETTLGYALEAAAARGIPLFVLDRPDPQGADRFGGPVLDAGRESFTGYFPLPLLPGLTVGELAALFNAERHIGADLRVIPMTGYARAMRPADTGLGWVPPSPNLRTPAQLDLYPDVALLEGANVSVGRGTAHPFEWIGAPWMDDAKLAAALNSAQTDVRFEPIDFVPTESRWHGVLCHGVRVVKANPAREPARVGLTMIATLHALWPDTFDLAATRDAVGSTLVSNALRDAAVDAAVDTAATIAAADSARFRRVRARYLRY